MLAGFQRTTLYLSVKLHAAVRIRAWETNTSMSKLMERWAWEGIERDDLAAYIAKREGRAPTSPATRPSEPTG